jgi:hypothetical protein
MPRPQFTLRALLVVMLVVGAFFGGMALQRQLDAPVITTEPAAGHHNTCIQFLEMPDGTRWYRFAEMEFRID